MAWSMNGLINHPIIKDETNMGLLDTHTKGGEAVLMWNKIHLNGNVPLLLGGMQ